ncbi:MULTISPECIES: hypothetical protein [Streptomyces]|uniref:Uncharacterized protein n=2 Tax=Streptomyces TaxID=1883 RepID=A0ABV9IJJ9_9ACTN
MSIWVRAPMRVRTSPTVTGSKPPDRTVFQRLCTARNANESGATSWLSSSFQRRQALTGQRCAQKPYGTSTVRGAILDTRTSTISPRPSGSSVMASCSWSFS